MSINPSPFVRNEFSRVRGEVNFNEFNLVLKAVSFQFYFSSINFYDG